MWRDRWLGWRNAVLASRRFQRFALRLPPMRPVARAHAQRLFDLVAGFTYSQTLFACVELDLFRRIGLGTASISELAAMADLPVATMGQLVDAAAALNLLDRTGPDRVALGVAGAALLGNPGVAEMVRHHRHLYADLADPVGVLRRPGSGQLARYWGYAQDGMPEAVAEYSALMAASAEPVIDEALRAYHFGAHARLLDVGGGEGRFLGRLHERWPALSLGLFDLPPVVTRAGESLASMADLHGGDFRHDSLPPGYDCMTLVRVLHDHDDPLALALLRRIRAALPPGGKLIIAEPMAGPLGAARVGATYFAFYLRAMGSGRARSVAEIGALLREAGFSSWQSRPTQLPLNASVIVASVDVS